MIRRTLPSAVSAGVSRPQGRLGWEVIGARLRLDDAANSSPPPCGEGSGVGVEPVCTPVPLGTTPHPDPPPPYPPPLAGEGREGGVRPLNKAIEIGNSRFRLRGGCPHHSELSFCRDWQRIGALRERVVHFAGGAAPLGKRC